MMQQQQHQQRGSRSRRSAARPFAEIRVRDKNMKMQLQLGSECAKFKRDWSAWIRDNEKSERDLLLDLAHMMDAKLTPSVNDWFEKRRIRQASCLPDLPRRRRIRHHGDAPDGLEVDDGDDEEDDGDSAMRLLDRQRILEAKRTDWLGVTSVPARLLPRPATAAAAARVAAASAGIVGEDSTAAIATASGPAGADPSLASAAAAASASTTSVASLALGSRPKTAGFALGPRKAT